MSRARAEIPRHLAVSSYGGGAVGRCPAAQCVRCFCSSRRAALMRSGRNGSSAPAPLPGVRVHEPIFADGLPYTSVTGWHVDLEVALLGHALVSTPPDHAVVFRENVSDNDQLVGE